MKKLYLAGKIARDDWRHDLVPGLGDSTGAPNWRHVDCDGFTYVGPFFATFGHGMSHGPNQHGTLDAGVGLPTKSRAVVAEQCYAAINACDVFFAWIDDLTAFGTLVELGFAFSRGKKLVVATSRVPTMPKCSCGHCGFGDPVCHDGHLSDLWFAFITAGQPVVAPTPQQALRKYLASVTPKIDPALALLESPIEKQFWAQHTALKLPALAGLVPQHPVLGGRYRLDFALPDQRVAVELDGYEYHSSKEAFVRDRERQRALEAAGWRVIRFAGSEVYNDAAGCVRQTAALVSR